MKHALLILFSAALSGQTLVTISDTLYAPDGTKWAGKMTISGNMMSCSSRAVRATNKTLTITAGVLSTQLYSTAECGTGQAYTVRYTDTGGVPSGTTRVAYWVVPASPTTTTVAAIETFTASTPLSSIQASQVNSVGVTTGYYLRSISGVSQWAAGSGGGGGDVLSVFGRIGSIVATTGDYTTAQVTESGNLYFTTARAQAALSGLYEVPLTFSGALSRTTNTITCPTCLLSSASYSDPTWLSLSVAGGRISGLATVASTGTYSDLSGRPTIPSSTSDITEGSRLYYTDARVRAAMGGTTVNGLPVATGSAFALSVLPSCSDGTTSKLLYNSSTQTFTCGTDQTGAGGSGITSLGGLTATTQTFAKTDDTNVTLGITSGTSTHTFALGWSGQLAIGRGGTGASTASGARTALELGGAAVLNVGTTTGTVAAGDDSRMSNARTPTAHASTHGSGQADAITVAQSQVTSLTTDLAAKASTTHAASHASGQSDAVTLAQSQISNLTTDLSAKAPADSPTFTGTVTTPITGSTQCLHVNTSGVLSGTGSDCASGSGGADASGYYLVGQSTSAPANAINLGLLSSGLLKMSVAAGVATFSTASAGTDYQAALGFTAENTANKGATNGYASLSGGVVPIAQVPTGTSGTTVALGNHAHSSTYEPVVTAGTTSQYYRGDKAWTTLDTSAVSGLATALGAKEDTLVAGTNLQYYRGDKTWQTLNAAAVSGLAASATTDTTNASNIASGTVATARLGSGSASSSTYLRGDSTWATPAGGSSAVISYPNTRRWTYIATNGQSTMAGIGDTVTPQGTASAGTASDTAPAAVNYATGTSQNATGGLYGWTMWRSQRNIRLQTWAQLPAAGDYASGAVRVWLVMTDQAYTTQMQSNTPTARFFGFRAMAGTDTNWTCAHANASTLDTADSGVAVDTTGHAFEAYYDFTGSTVYYYIDGTRVCSGISQTNRPATGYNLRYMTMTDLADTSATARNIKLGWVFVEADK